MNRLSSASAPPSAYHLSQISPPVVSGLFVVPESKACNPLDCGGKKFKVCTITNEVEWIRLRVGRLVYERFDAAKWTPEYHNLAFAKLLPEDAFWAARQVLAVTDEQIRALVKTGQFSDPHAEAWVAECLIKHRDKVGQAFLNQVLPLDFFQIENGQLTFVDLSAKDGLGESGPFSIAWATFDNARSEAQAFPDAAGPQVPATTTGFLQATITGKDQKRIVRVYLREHSRIYQLVGVERT